MAFVIVTILGTLGDALPYIAVGAALRRRGHDVALVSSPAFERQAREADLELVPVGTLDEYREFIQDPELWDRETVVRAAVKYWLRNGQGLTRPFADPPAGDTLLFRAGEPPALLAQEKLGIPYAPPSSRRPVWGAVSTLLTPRAPSRPGRTRSSERHGGCACSTGCGARSEGGTRSRAG